MTNKQDIQISFTGDVGKVMIGDVKFEITPDSRVVAYTDQPVKQQPADTAATEDPIASIGKDFAVAVYGAKIMKTEAGFTIQASSIALSPSANKNSTSLALQVLEVGERLRDGTVVLSVDLEKNEALFVPAGIFGGEAEFSQQDNVVKKVNSNAAHGHNDWRRITDAEGETLSKVWDKVAPPALQGAAAPWFWLATPDDSYLALVRRGGEEGWGYTGWYRSNPVPVVRSGPAQR